MKSNIWGASPKLEEHPQLKLLDEFFDGNYRTIEEAQPLTVLLRGVMITVDKDGLLRGDNDLMIVTTSQFGAEPEVQRLHYMHENVALGWEGAFFHSTVLSLRDFKPAKQRLTLRAQIYDTDKLEEGIVGLVGESSQSVAVTFPALARYAAGVTWGSKVLINLVDKVDQHDKILDERFTLEVGERGQGRSLLQRGFYVVFADEIDASTWTLGRNLHVVKEDGTEIEPDVDQGLSYAVFEVRTEYLEHRNWEIDQKTAKLVAELDGKGGSGRAALEFLRETMEAYDNFGRLQRALQLKKKKTQLAQENESLSDEEQKLLDELLEDEALKPYLGEEG